MGGVKMPSHEFIKLVGQDYVNSQYVPQTTGAQIGLDHIHMYNAIKRQMKDATIISNYYSDAVMGWDTIPHKENTLMQDSDYYKKLQNNHLFLRKEIKEAIKIDLEKICIRWPEQGNFSCMNEFIYVTERNPKFHIRMSAMCRSISNVVLPYADYQLLNIMISIPLENRADKLIEKKIIGRYLNIRDISSRRYSERSRFTEKNYSMEERLFYLYGYYKMRVFQAFNVFLAKFTHYRLQIVNPYITENQNYVLNKSLWNLFNESIDYLAKESYISADTFRILKRKEYRSIHTSLKYSIISVYLCIKRNRKNIEKEDGKKL